MKKINFTQIIIIAAIIAVVVIASQVFIKYETKACVTCVCEDKDKKENIGAAFCNFDSITTKDNLDGKPKDSKKLCQTECEKKSEKYKQHFEWIG